MYAAGDTYEEIWKDVFQMMQTNEKLKSEWDGKMANAYAYDSVNMAILNAMMLRKNWRRYRQYQALV